MADDEIRLVQWESEPRWARGLSAVAVVALVGWIVFAVLRGKVVDWVLPGVPMLAFSAWSFVASRRPLIIDAQGIRLPLRRLVPWDDVRAVRATGPYSECVVLLMREGPERRLPLPPDQSERVAAIGDKPLV